MKKKLNGLCFLDLKNIKKLLLVLKLTAILLFLGMITAYSSNSYSQVTKFTLNLKDVTLKQLFQEIEDNSEFIFIYSDDLIDVTKSVKVKAKQDNIEEVLNQAFKGLGYDFVIDDRQIIINQNNKYSSTLSTTLQEKTVTGKVISTTGEPIPGATVIVKGTVKGTTTDPEGNFTLAHVTEDAVLVISFVGMKSQEIVVGEEGQLVIVLEEDVVGVEEVVVTALGIEKKAKALGYAAQELGTTELDVAREGNIGNALSGKVAGVRITRGSGGVGGSTSIIVRGVNSLKGSNMPLFVVDGVPITNIGHSSGGTNGDLDTGDGIGDLNSEDIESMQVLKGPSASALYGSRGANGVILITTKSGAKKKGIGVEINSNVSFENINLLPKRQNLYATGYGSLGSEVEIPAGSGQFYPTIVHAVDNWGPPMDGSIIVSDPYLMPGEAPRTMPLLPQPEDNIIDFYQTGLATSNTIAISSSGDKTTTRLSLGNTTNKGIIPNWSLNKQTVSFSANSQVTDNLSFTGKFIFIRDEGNNRPYLGGGGSNVSNYLMFMARTVPLDFLKKYYEETGTFGSFPGVFYNPYYIVNELKNNDVKDRYIGQISLNLKLNSWLSLLGRFGSDVYTQKGVQIWPVGARSSNAPGRLINDIDIVKDLNADAILSANKDISSTLNINGIIGASISHQRREGSRQNGYRLKAPKVYNIGNCTEIQNSEYLSRKEIQSVYFTGQVGYKNYLFLDITGRNDWSSTLGINNYSFFYPSVSTSFVFTDALESIPSDILTFGKIRASWAQVGNDASPYLTSSGYALTTTTYEGKNLSWINSEVPLVDLKNELTEAWEIGADLRFLKNRLSVDATYYNSKTTNQIVPMNLSSSTGYSNVIINAGEIQNKGVELTLNLTPIKTRSGFRWDINFNYAANRSKVVELGPGIESLTLASSGYAGYVEARVGRPFGDIIGRDFAKAPDGRLLVNDLGYYYAASETSVLGSVSPKWTGGLNNTLSFKGFSLNVLLDIVQGNSVMSNTMFMLEGKGLAPHTLEGRRPQFTDEEGNEMPYINVLDGVHEVDDGSGNITYVENDIAISGMNTWAQRAWGGITKSFVLDGSYVSLREVILSYSLSPSLLKNIPVSGIKLSAVGRNLFYIENHMKDIGISPESAPNTSASSAGIETYTRPSTRTWGFNVKINF